MDCIRCNERPVYCKQQCLRCYYATRRGTDTRAERAQRRNFVRDEVGVLTTRSGEEFLVDLADFEQCRQYLWTFTQGYAANHQVGTLHRFLLPGCDMVDHIDRDTHNNRQANLRDGSGGVNSRNSRPRASASGWRGVHRMRDRWQARIVIDGVKYRGGTFDSVEEAACAVHDIAVQHGVGLDYPAP